MILRVECWIEPWLPLRLEAPHDWNLESSWGVCMWEVESLALSIPISAYYYSEIRNAITI